MFVFSKSRCTVPVATRPPSVEMEIIVHQDAELVQLHTIEEVEGAKGKLTGGEVKVDYATGEVKTAA